MNEASQSINNKQKQITMTIKPYSEIGKWYRIEILKIYSSKDLPFVHAHWVV